MITKLRTLSRTLVFRLSFSLALAILPIGLIAVSQTLKLVNEAASQVRDSLLALTAEAATQEEIVIRSAVSSAETIASISREFGTDGLSCGPVVTAFKAAHPELTYVGVTDANGLIDCGTAPEPTDLGGHPIFEAMKAQPSRMVDIVEKPIVGSGPVVAITVPIMRNGVFGGMVALSMPHNRIYARLEDMEGGHPMDLVTFNQRGDILSTEAGRENVRDRLPQSHTLADLAKDGRQTFVDTDANGNQRVYIVVTVIRDSVYALGIWNDDALALEGGVVDYVLPILFPVVMWLACLFVAYLTINRFVIRPLRNLRARMLVFMRSRKMTSGKYDFTMSTELREIDETWHRMAEDILHEEAALEDTIHDKNVLLKEVHHRVKNNLQLIASILNLKIRRSRTPEARRVLEDVHARVMSMATAHRYLYEAGTVGGLGSDELLQAIINHVSASALPDDSPVDMQSSLASLAVYPDQAVPLSLVATEAITNALKYIGRPATGTPWIRTTLVRVAEEACLEISNSVGEPLDGDSSPVESTGLGEQLIRAFASQLDARIETEKTDESYTLRLFFTMKGFDEN